MKLIVKKTIIMNYFNQEKSEWTYKLTREKGNPKLVRMELTTEYAEVRKIFKLRTNKSDIEIKEFFNIIFPKYEQKFAEAGLFTKVTGMLRLTKEIKKFLGKEIH